MLITPDVSALVSPALAPIAHRSCLVAAALPTIVWHSTVRVCSKPRARPYRSPLLLCGSGVHARVTTMEDELKEMREVISKNLAPKSPSKKKKDKKKQRALEEDI